MSGTLPRISRFWLERGYLLDPSDPIEDAPRYWFGVEETDAGEIVHRFRTRTTLAYWIGEGVQGTRRHVLAREQIVKEAKRRDFWPDDGWQDDEL